MFNSYYLCQMYDDQKVNNPDLEDIEIYETMLNYLEDEMRNIDIRDEEENMHSLELEHYHSLLSGEIKELSLEQKRRDLGYLKGQMSREDFEKLVNNP